MSALENGNEAMARAAAWRRAQHVPVRRFGFGVVLVSFRDDIVALAEVRLLFA
jgi:hypothetical protein